MVQRRRALARARKRFSCAIVSEGRRYSAVVINEVLKFAGAHPDWRIYLLKVIEQRRPSDTVAERLGVRHESPQAFVIRPGRCVWHGSHGGITAKQLGQYEQAS